MYMGKLHFDGFESDELQISDGDISAPMKKHRSSQWSVFTYFQYIVN
jgi:hypothetical protein